jgi:hypothetical protein
MTDTITIPRPEQTSNPHGPESYHVIMRFATPADAARAVEAARGEAREPDDGAINVIADQLREYEAAGKRGKRKDDQRCAAEFVAVLHAAGYEIVPRAEKAEPVPTKTWATVATAAAERKMAHWKDVAKEATTEKSTDGLATLRADVAELATLVLRLSNGEYTYSRERLTSLRDRLTSTQP